LEQGRLKTILPHSEPKGRALVELVIGMKAACDTQIVTATDSPSTQCMHSDGIHLAVPILTDPRHILHRISTAVDILGNIQGDSDGMVVFGDYSFGHCEKKVHMNMCLTGNGYRDTAVGKYKHKSSVN
jgi:hypothetical protein